MTRAFGWLDATHAFRSGECPAEVLAALETAARAMTDRTRGWHLCEICGNRTYGPTPYETSTGSPLELGSAVIQVSSAVSEAIDAYLGRHRR